MAGGMEFRVLVASDGSVPATAATVTAACFPWPPGTRAFGVVSHDGMNLEREALTTEVEEAAASTVEATTKALVGRWSGVQVHLTSGPAAAAIVRMAKRLHADVIVMGWRGHGPVRRLLSGSVSRGVVRAAPCSVLVVRRAVRNVINLVIGIDGSEQSSRAITLAARLTPPSGGRILLVTALPLVSDRSNSLLPSPIRRPAASGVGSINNSGVADARANLETLAKQLRSGGWRVDVATPSAAPLQALVTAVQQADADLLVVGATGASQLSGLLLGGVAQGALDRSPVPVLIVR